MDMNKKLQSATEYLMVVGFVMVILIPGIYLYVQYSQESNDSIINAKVDSITNEIVKAAEQVYSYGEGSQTLLNVDIPKNVVAIGFDGNEIVFTVLNSKGGSSEIVKVSNVKLNGFVTIIPGNKKINLKSEGNEVLVYSECSEDAIRCGFDWECNKFLDLEGFPEGTGCKVICENNVWRLQIEDPEYGGVCLDGCTEGQCVACEPNVLRCSTEIECPGEECVYQCSQEGLWQFVNQCVEPTIECNNGQCVECTQGQQKFGENPEYPECGENPGDECVLSCGLDNQWEVQQGGQC